MTTKIGSVSIEGLKRLKAFHKSGKTDELIKAYGNSSILIKPEEIIELELSAELPNLRTGANEEDVKKEDEINTIKLHQSLATLTPAEASSIGIWVWFTHVYYWNYMRERWPVPHSGGRTSLENFISTHYFIKGQNTRSFIRNGIARLWWYGYLSVNNGEYLNTAILLRQLDIASQLLERSQGRNKDIRNIFFQKLLHFKDKFLEKGNDSRNRVRIFAKKINMFGSFHLIDSFPQKELEDTFDKIIHEVLQEVS